LDGSLGDGRILIEIQGNQYPAFLDDGADASVIPTNILDKISADGGTKLTITPTPELIARAFNDSKVETHGTVQLVFRLLLQHGLVAFHTTFLVIDGAKDIILGRPELRQIGLKPMTTQYEELRNNADDPAINRIATKSEIPPELPASSRSPSENNDIPTLPDGAAFIGDVAWRNMRATPAFETPLNRTTMVTTAALNASIGWNKSNTDSNPVTAANWVSALLNVESLSSTGTVTTSLQVRTKTTSAFYLPEIEMTVITSNVSAVLLGQDFLDQRLSSNEEPQFFEKDVPEEDKKITAYLKAELKLSMDLSSAPPGALENLEQLILGDGKRAFRLSLTPGLHADVPQVKTELKEGAIPPKMPVRHFRPDMLRDMIRLINQYVEWGVLSRNTTSQWLSPINMVRKPDGSWRLTCDDTYMNRQRQLWRGHPLKTRQQLEMFFLDCIAFGATDMLKGFYQIPIHPDSRHLHCIWTPFGHYQFNCVVMGSHNACHQFQMAAENVFQPCMYTRPATTVQYIDDGAQISTNSTTSSGEVICERHPDAQPNEDDAWYFLVDHWAKLFKICIARRVFLNPKKTQLLRDELKFLGDVFTRDGIQADPERTQGLRDAPLPTLASELYHLISVAGWMRDKIPDLAALAHPMRLLVDAALAIKGKRTIKSIEKVKLTDVGWTDNHVSQYKTLINAMVNTIQRACFDPDKVTCIWSDASELHFSMMLTQCAPGELEKPLDDQRHDILVCNSGTFTRAQLKYSMKDKEAWPQILVTTQYEHYLWGNHPAQAFCDHKCLGVLFRDALKPTFIAITRHKRITRWAMHWLQYNITLNHIAGDDNGRVDVLSRGLAAANGGILRQPSTALTTTRTSVNINVVMVEPDAEAIASDAKYLINSGAVLAKRSPWPSARDIRMAQDGAKENFKVSLRQLGRSKILVAGGPRHEQDRLPTWKQICDIKSGKGRYVIELFAGAGGAACGIKLAGGISLAGFDNNETALQSYELNISEAAPILMNIWDSEKVITTIKRILLTGGIDEWELWWSASCQPWSRANRDPRKSTDKRRRWPIHVANIVNALRDNDASPSVIYSENITHAKKAQEWKDGLNIIANTGYDLYQADINSKFTGSCTDRPRWFVVFIKKSHDYKCFLPDIAKIIQTEPATTLGQILPHRKVTYYYAAFNSSNSLFGQNDQIPGLRVNSWRYNPEYQSNDRERARGYDIADTVPPSREDFKAMMGWDATAHLPADKKAFMQALAQCVVPNVAQLVFSSVQRSGKRLQKLINKLTAECLDAPTHDVIFIPRGDQCKDDRARKRSEQLVASIIAVAHQGVSGHRPPDVTLKTLKKLFYFDNMASTVKNMVGNCLQCLKNRKGDWVTRPMGSALLGDSPNEVIHMDFFYIGPQYQLTIKDSLTGFCRLCLTKDCTALSAATELVKWFADFGVCDWLVSDGGPHFKNQILEAMSDLIGFHHHINTAYIHQAAGTVEVLQQRTKALLRKLCGELGWDFKDAGQLLPAVQYSVNHTRNSRGVIPSQVFIGIAAKTPLQALAILGAPKIKNVRVKEVAHLLLKACHFHVKRVRAALDVLHTKLLDDTIKSRRKDRKRSAKSKARGKIPYMPRVQAGDLVLISTPERSAHKLRFTWQGPFVVNGPTDSDVWVRSSHGTNDDGSYTAPAFADSSTHVYNVHLLGDKQISKKVHVSNMIAFASNKLGKDSRAAQQLAEAARHDFQQGFAVESIVGHSIDDGELKLLVQWLGFTDIEATLEPLTNLHGCEALVRDYCRTHRDEHGLIDDHFNLLTSQRRLEQLRINDARTSTRKSNARRKAQANQDKR
jgi:site-specific DNA-cytosine methylase